MSRRKQARPVRLLDEDGTPCQPNEDVEAQPHNDDPNNQFASVLDPNNCGDSSNSGSEEEIVSGVSGGSLPPETHMCPRCHEQFTEMPEFLAHRTLCDNKARRHHEPAHSDPEDMVVSGDEDDDEECGGKRLEEVRRHRQDAANNNSVGDEDEEEDEDEAGTGAEGQTFPFPVTPAAAGHVTLEALQNTKVAVAQFAATTMANNADNEAALQELAVLQSTLFTLQHQQVFQLQLINQLQRQLSINRTKDDGSPISPPLSEGAASLTPGIPALNIPQPTTATPPSPPRIPRVIPLQPRDPSPPHIPSSTQPPTSQSLPATKPDNQSLSHENNNSPPTPSCLTVSSTTTTPAPSVPTASQPPLCSISSSLASTIITNNDPPPSLDEPNTLEMLQRRAQEVLDNASQGLLASNLADELAFRKGKGSMSPYDSKSGRNEPFFKHRCRYCGKVFGSDSALQIHIRSHTGERPFKCNVCGSRFTTKGNLKVHFQRHTAKFPHIKMNPNPVPEHLDKYHPPLLAQLGPNRPVSPGMPPHPGHPLQFPGGHPFPLYRPPPGPPHDLLPPRGLTSPQRPDGPLRPIPPHPIFIRRDEQDMPENLSKPPQMSRSSPSPPPPPPPPRHDTLVEPRCKSEPIEDLPRRDSSRRNSETHSEDAEIIPKQEPSEHEPDIGLENEQSERFRDESPPIAAYDDCSMESKYSNEDMMLGPDSPAEHGLQDQPENLSSKSQSITTPLSIATGQRLPASFPFSHAASPPSSASSGSLGTFPIPPPGADPARDPAVYTSLLPRPGSNDNSWESLIEVTKTSETSKLQQLVDNIEYKLTDPNQCVICHRVLSCKSALQMHYRTHTGERPFKCKICGRAFTTKGNLKTHMGVHRAKPPMRVLHQCPVCHKKFTNALVLQQHIRLHTGEPTDLTPEQIQAAEIKDFPSPGGFPMPNPFLNQGFPIPGLSPLGPPGFPTSMTFKPGDYESMKDDHPDFMEEDEDDDDESSITNEQHLMPSFSTSLSALENQVRTITTMASQLSASGLSQSNEDLSMHSRLMASTPLESHMMQNGEKTPDNDDDNSRGIPSPHGSESTNNGVQRPESSQRAATSSPTPSESNSLGALDLTPRSQQPAPPHGSIPISSASQSPSPIPNQLLHPPPPPPPPPPPGVFTNFGLLPSIPTSTSPLMTSALSSLTSSVLTSTAFSPLGLAVGPAVRGNTTCNICFKTFACNSALEIHYRSHTKERPFKCSVCDRGFSTKDGNEEGCLCGQGRIQDGGGPLKRFRKRSANPSPVSTPKIQITNSSKLPPPASPGYASQSEWINPNLLGNMKQHMLTHKIRDMPQHMFDKPSPGNASGGAGTPGLPLPQMSSASSTGSSKDDSRNSLGNIINIPERPDLNSSLSNDPMDHRDMVAIQHQASSLPPPEMPMKATDLGGIMKRSPPETELPLPKRQPTIPHNHKSSPDLDISLNYDKNSFRAMKEMELGMHSMLERVAERVRCSVFAGGVSPIMQQTQTPNPQQSSQPQSQQSSQQSSQSNKHLCHVCNKNFSSSSALQIHMRTHTGDKPFRCTVCQKAFTTKGNLKVHMGTHMWSNGASRRGRRMSLDLPPIPMTPKDSEFLQRRPDLFYPYLPAPFLNGMQQKNPGNGLPSPGKYASLLGFGYPPVSEPLRSQPSSPLSDKPPSSVASSSPPRDPIERAGSVGTGSNNGNGSGSGAGSGAGPGGGRDGREMLPRVWDLHYERQTASEEDVVVSPSNGTINVPNPNQIGVPPPTARGEGLAA